MGRFYLFSLFIAYMVLLLRAKKLKISHFVEIFPVFRFYLEVCKKKFLFRNSKAKRLSTLLFFFFFFLKISISYFFRLRNLGSWIVGVACFSVFDSGIGNFRNRVFETELIIIIILISLFWSTIKVFLTFFEVLVK